MNYLLGYVCLTIIFLSLVVIFYNRGYNGPNRYLGSFFLVSSLYTIGLSIGFYGDSQVLSALLGPTTIPLYYLIGPLGYLYIRSVLRDDQHLSRWDYLHFAIFVIQIAGMMPFYLSSWDHKMEIAGLIQSENWTMPFLQVNLIPTKFNFILRPVQITAYLLACWYLLWNYRRTDHSSVPKAQFGTIWRWLVVFLTVITIWFGTTLLIMISHMRYSLRSEFLSHVQMGLALTGIMLITLIINLLLNPQVLYGLPKVTGTSGLDGSVKKEESGFSGTSVEDPAGREGPHAIITRLPELQKDLDSLMEEKKPYLDSNFSIATLSVITGIPMHHLRYYFSQYRELSFATYRNRLRVEYVKRLIEEGEDRKHSVEGLGQLAGFSSKSSFFAAIKTETGMTPLEYQQSLTNPINLAK